MKAIIFAGGTGTRLWPLSRKKSPKQFEKIIGNKSTLELSIERLIPDFAYKDIYISTNIAYKKIITKQLNKIPKDNFIFEPEKKDVGPAIALAMGIFNNINPNEPVAILWSDHLVKRVAAFKKVLKSANEYIKKNPNKIVFIAHKPRYASVNLGYIHLGKKRQSINGVSLYAFEGFKYRPDGKTANNFLKSGKYAWNLGYFVTSAGFIFNAFKCFSPDIYNNTNKILSRYGKEDYEKYLNKYYADVKSISFDNAILENLNKKDALVIVEDIGWSDIGTWEAVKEALEQSPDENVIKGNVTLKDVRDSLIYNYEAKKLVVGIDLDDLMVVNTSDVLLISKKKSVSKIKTLVENFQGTENEKLT